MVVVQVLYSSGAKTWMRLVTGVEWLHASDAACRCLTFMFVASLHLSAWLVVLTTADRFVAVWFPLKAASFCSQSRARLASLCLLVATVLFDGHIFWTFDLLPEGRSASQRGIERRNDTSTLAADSIWTHARRKTEKKVSNALD